MDINRYFIEHKPLRYYGDLISYLIEILPDAANLKDASTKKYILSNFYWAELLGFKSIDDICGLTADCFYSDDGILNRDYGMSHDYSLAFSNWRKSESETFKSLFKVFSAITQGKRSGRIGGWC